MKALNTALLLLGLAGCSSADWGGTLALVAEAARDKVSASSIIVDCDAPPESTFTVDLGDDSITIPNGRPIYAIFVTGLQGNEHFDELMCYRFARHLMAHGAYVHWSRWNNLLAPYMERPLHSGSSNPGVADLLNITLYLANKGDPSEDFQFQADARALLEAIRRNNPSAIIILAGHSMGGGSVARLATETNVVIDILALIEPGENRSTPVGQYGQPWYNWTHWRIARDEFRGYRQYDCVRDPISGFCVFPFQCILVGDWLEDRPVFSLAPTVCFVSAEPDSDPPRRVFHANIINLFHRYQKEFWPEFDFGSDEHFDHVVPPGGTSSQRCERTCPGWVDPGDCSRQTDPGGYCHDKDGHGELIGFRAIQPFPQLIPTIEKKGLQPQNWPAPGESSLRVQRLKHLEQFSLDHGEEYWWGADGLAHEPLDPSLCLMSPQLIELFETMNRPPSAEAGPDQVIECAGPLGADVTLDGTGSTDPDNNDILDHVWLIPGQFAVDAPKPTVTLPIGRHCIVLITFDPNAHQDRDTVVVTVQDTTGPALSVALTPRYLWPPNHKLVDIHATVEAVDLCGQVTELELVSIVSSEADNGLGDGDTAGDIVGADIGTLDLDFKLRAERSGQGNGRVYTVTYQATDDAGNRTETSADVVVASGP